MSLLLAGSEIDLNTLLLRKIIDLQTTSKKMNHSYDSTILRPEVLAELIHHSISVAFTPKVIRDSASLVGGKEAHRALFLESLHTLSEVSAASIDRAIPSSSKQRIATTPWSEMSVLRRNVLQKALHEYQTFDCRETTSLLTSVSKMGVQWYTLNDDIRYTLNRCLKQANSYSALSSDELCLSIHALAKMKVYWSGIPNLSGFKQSLVVALNNMTPQQVVAIVTDLAALESTWTELSSHVLLSSLGQAIRTATYQLSLQVVGFSCSGCVLLFCEFKLLLNI